MKNKPGEFDAEEINLITLAQEYSEPDKARELLESLRWPNGPECPHCKRAKSECRDVYKIVPKPGSSTRRGLYKCAACRQQFTVTVGTIFEDSHISISKWLMALFIMCSSKKAVSAHQLHRMLGITYKTAWFMAHRIRYAMGPRMSGGKRLKGVVEVDETFVGGKGEMQTRSKRKTPVVALVERQGEVRTQVVANVSQKNLGRCIADYVDKGAVVNTDDSGALRGTLKAYKAHHVVNHSAKEYALKMADGAVAHVNTCESFFSLLKRGVVGSWHHVSREHLPKYVDEFAFRWNNRKVSDGERTVAAIKAVEGRRLTYRQAA